MQPVRVIIAAIFFVIGALIVIPAFTGGNSTSDASSTAEPTASGTPTSTHRPTSTPTSTRRPTGTPSKSTSPTASKSASPSPSRTSASPTPSRTPTATKPPAPAPTATTAKPQNPPPADKPSVQPLTVSFGRVKCPSDRITVKVTNDAQNGQAYSITRNGSLVLADRLGPNSSRTSPVTLSEDKTVVVRVTQDGKPQASRSYKLDCARAAASPKPTERLPYTGSDRTVMVARIATGVASLVTGMIILWWGGLWPGRRDRMFGRADRG